ncbi:MAG TPA: hypothetical protein VHX63_10045 [Acidobacteriaceae bacterium]|jgi:hypothetical protein|nr:hypothetical protein [Acidobacteriaceae bacterium]
MRGFKYLAVIAIAIGLCFAATPTAQAQVGITIGVAPVCPYGYFDYSPYSCAPYGYYGPEWFTGGIFIGAGPWFHGPRGFHGHVNNRYDPHHGYHGAIPHAGQRAAHGPAPSHFKGNEARDGRGHTVNERSSKH